MKVRVDKCVMRKEKVHKRFAFVDAQLKELMVIRHAGLRTIIGFTHELIIEHLK